MKKFVFALFLSVFSTLFVNGQIIISSTGATYSENFNTLSNSTSPSDTIPSGWVLYETGSNANSKYSVGSGTGTGGDTYSFGSSGNSDRAFGGIRSGSLIPTIGASFTNNTGSPLQHVTITYTGEQWRRGNNTSGLADRIDFQISSDASSLSTGNWKDIDALDFSSKITDTSPRALDGNATANRAVISNISVRFTSAIPNGASFWIRWNDLDIAGSDDGLAIDDFSLFVPTDQTSPTVTNPVVNSQSVPSTQSLVVNASDSESGVGSVSIIYGVNTQTPNITVVCSQQSGSVYLCEIPSTANGSYVTFYISVSDGAGNTTQTPSSAAPNVYTVGSGAIVPAGLYSFAALGTSTLAGNITVTGSLSLNGIVDGSTYAVTLPCGAVILNAGSTNYINGFVDHTLCAATPTTYEYPVGTPAGYAPVSIVVNSYTGSTSLGVSPHDGAMQGVNTSTSLKRTWNIVRTGADTDTIDANVTFHYNDSDINGGDENNFKIFKKDGTTLTNYCYVPVNTLGLSPCSIDTASNTATANGVTSFSQWTLGESLLSPTASDAAISGQVLTADGRGISGAEVTVNGSSLEAPKRAVTNAFGYYTIEGVVAGQGYIVSVGAKRHVFAVPARFVTVGDNITDLDFTALP